MAVRVYSRLYEIPDGYAGENITEGCLVLEGEASRGLYTQRFLDELIIRDINIRCVIGCYAGALGGMNYVSGQIGRSGRILKEIATKCYYTEYFKWDQSKRILQYIKENYKMTKNFILIPMNGGYERDLVAAFFLQNNNLTPC